MRNWDYRYCWLRDATFILVALIGRLPRRAQAWREWLLRAIAGSAAQMQIMYGVRGERRLDESNCPGCPATKIPSRCAWVTPLRINSNSMFTARSWPRCIKPHRAGIETSEADWSVQVAVDEVSGIKLEETR